MVFSSLIFLYGFLPIVLVLYFLSPAKLKNIILLASSLFFYAWGEPKLVILMLISIAANYLFGLWIGRTETTTKRKALVAGAVVSNLAILGYYKYAGFLVDIFEDLTGQEIAFEGVPLPIGISFYTFQAMSYIIDVYRKDADVQRNPLNLALYISLFPQLVAGPIVRYQTVADQIRERLTTSDRLVTGSARFIQGLAKKVLIANPMGRVADEVFAMSGGDLTTATAWIGILAYTLQIYFDFSGYSDMAIGLGKLFGFDFLENFNYPYISQSISEFWRRWHISLGSWFRDYVYIPLGGNRVDTWKIYRNLLVVWTLTGFWHGASWTFMAWGFYYGVLISLEKWFLQGLLNKMPRFIRHVYVLVIVMIGWVFFRADDFDYAFHYIGTLFGLAGAGLFDHSSILYATDYWLYFMVAIILSMPLYPKLRHWFQGIAERRPIAGNILSVAASAWFLLLVAIVTMYLVNETHNPFIYFRF